MSNEVDGRSIPIWKGSLWRYPICTMWDTSVEVERREGYRNRLVRYRIFFDKLGKPIYRTKPVEVRNPAAIGVDQRLDMKSYQREYYRKVRRVREGRRKGKYHTPETSSCTKQEER
jgi:hypothetical protein